LEKRSASYRFGPDVSRLLAAESKLITKTARKGKEMEEEIILTDREKGRCHEEKDIWLTHNLTAT